MLERKETRPVEIDVGEAVLQGDLGIPSGARGLVVFAHGSGSSRLSPRNRSVARALREGGLGTLLFDLLTAEEEEVDLRTRHLRFDIGLLARRLVGSIDWLAGESAAAGLGIGTFGSSTGAAAALIATWRWRSSTGCGHPRSWSSGGRTRR
jgi:putative phosphoribosyl transferase